MKGIDHLVLAGRDLDAMRRRYAALGFTLTPQALHPFGTGNSLVQLQGCFLELLTVVEPSLIPEHAPDHFSFAAFNRDFLERREGLSMLVLDSADARADAAAFRVAGVTTFPPFDFSRKAKLPDGGEATVGFSTVFATLPGATAAGFFTCQQHAPQHFWKPDYQRHANTARSIAEVALVAASPIELKPFLDGFSGVAGEAGADGLTYTTGRGRIVVLTPEAYFARYRLAPPNLNEGPRFAAFTLGVADLDAVVRHAADANIAMTGARGRYLLAPEDAFGTALGFLQIRDG
jgi:Glyoxalase-like domain